MNVKKGVNYSCKSQGAKGGKPFSAMVLQGGIFGWHNDWEEGVPLVIGRSQGC